MNEWEKEAEEIELPEKYKDRENKEELKKRYKNMQFEPGEAIGLLAAQSISEPATQMSINSEERIIVRDLKKDQIRTIEIGEFVDRLAEEYDIRKIKNSEVIRVPENLYQAPSLNKDGSIEWKPIREVSRHSSPKKLLEIKTSSGRTIKATDHHSFVKRENGKIKPVKGRELRKGDRIPVIRKLPVPSSNKELNMVRYFDKDKVWFGSEVKKLRKGKKAVVPSQSAAPQVKEGQIASFAAKSSPMPESPELDNSLGWVFGLYLADGSATSDYVNFSNNDPTAQEKIKDFAEELDFSYNQFDHDRGYGHTHDIRINSTLLAKFFKRAFATGSKKKKVPDWILNADEEFIGSILQGYFDGDGNVQKERKGVRASTRSKKLAEDISLLLNRLGIIATINQEKDSYVLRIIQSYLKDFKAKVGFSLDSKKKKLEQCLPESSSSQEFVDMITGYGDLLKRTAEKVDMPSRRVNNFTKRGRIGRKTLKRYIREFKGLAEEKGVDIKEELEEMRKLVKEDIFWDEIESIEYKEKENDYVYDLSVPGTETFTTCNGVITHNTMETYHAAGAAKVSITLGLPRLVEIIDARKNPKTPIMNVYLKEDYREKEKAKEVAAKIREVKFEDIIEEDTLDLLELNQEVVLNKAVMDDYMIEKEEVIEKLNDKLKKVKIKEDGDKLIIHPDKDDYDLKDLQKIRKKSKDVHLKGLKGINHVVIMKEQGEWKVQTAGTNLRKVLKIEGVDKSRTVSNDLYEVKKVLGIEAARNIIYEEIYNTLEEQGIQVDDRWLLLIADMMTKEGEVNGATRYGIVGAKKSVLARSSFEETKKHVSQAGIKGEKDTLESVVENIILGQVAPIGTGVLDLKAKPATVEKEPEKEKSEEKSKEEESEDFSELSNRNIKSIKNVIDEKESELSKEKFKGFLNKLLEAEKENKNRKTLRSFIEEKLEEEK